MLRIIGGSPIQPSPEDMNFRFYPRNGSRIYEIKAQLPGKILEAQPILIKTALL